MIDIWQCLLLVQTQLTQGQGHLTMQAGRTARISQFLVSLLSPHDEMQLSSTNRTRSLSLTCRLWSTARNVFASSWLEGMAKALLKPLLSFSVDFRNSELREAWSLLCADMLASASPEFLHHLLQTPLDKQEVELRRQLWIITHSQCVAENRLITDWHGLVSLLLSPIGYVPANCRDYSYMNILFLAGVGN